MRRRPTANVVSARRRKPGPGRNGRSVERFVAVAVAAGIFAAVSGGLGWLAKPYGDKAKDEAGKAKKYGDRGEGRSQQGENRLD